MYIIPLENTENQVWGRKKKSYTTADAGCYIVSPHVR